MIIGNILWMSNCPTPDIINVALDHPTITQLNYNRFGAILCSDASCYPCQPSVKFLTSIESPNLNCLLQLEWSWPVFWHLWALVTQEDTLGCIWSRCITGDAPSTAELEIDPLRNEEWNGTETKTVTTVAVNHHHHCSSWMTWKSAHRVQSIRWTLGGSGLTLHGEIHSSWGIPGTHC